MSEPAPGPGVDQHLRALDGLRGAAVLLVVAYHGSYLKVGWGPRSLPGGFVGVDVFFVLSGFLITRNLATDLATRGGIDLGSFAMRRIRRLIPALVFLVVGVVGFRAAFPHVAAATLTGDRLTTATGVWSGVGALGYVSNYQQAWGHPFVPELSHTWSLAIEGQYYLMWPFVLLAFRRLRVPRPAQLGLLILCMVVVWVHRAAMWTDQAHYLPLYLRTDTRIDVIIAGSILGLLTAWNGTPLRNGRWLRLPALGGVVVLGVVSCLSETGDVHLYRDYGLVAVTLAGTALVASAITDPAFALNRLWSTGPLRWLGQRSYSLYLWHVPVFLTVATNLGGRPIPVRVLIGLSVAFALAEFSYRVVETPLRRRRTARPSEAVAQQVS